MGILIPWLGFYWDDWAQLLAYQSGGANSFWTYFASDRPLSAWTHVLFSPVFGTSSVGWHLFSLGLRWLCAVVVWRLVHLLWPEREQLAILTGLFFLLSPLFSQQSIAVAYHQHWLQYLLFCVSLFSMAKAVRSTRRWVRTGYTAAGLFTQALQLSISEYFLAAELLRPAILWIVYAGMPKSLGWKKALRIGLTWLPFLLVLIGYLVYRFGFLKLPGGANSLVYLQNLLQNPVVFLPGLALTIFWDVFNMLIGTWGRVFSLSAKQIAQPFILAAWVLGGLSGLAVGAYFWRLKLPTGEQSEVEKSRPAPFLLGFLGVMLGPIPVWALGESMLRDPDPAHADRYALAAMLGAALLLAALVDWLGWKRGQQAVLAGWIVLLCVSFQLRAANEFRWLSIEQERFYQELFWRAPDPLPGTAFVTEKVIFPFQGNFSTSSAINLLYLRKNEPGKMGFWLYALLPRFQEGMPESGQANFQTRMRSFAFNGTSNQAVFLESGNFRQNCLWVLTDIDGDNPYISTYYKSWLNDSYRAQIGADRQAVPFFSSFQSQAVETAWCYYFEKAELAVQTGNWSEAARLGDLAQKAGFSPQNSATDSPREWAAFIEGFAWIGQWSQAEELTLAAISNDAEYKRMYCNLWKRLGDKTPGGGESGDRMRKQLGCADLP
jgi:hypothetical protein